MSNHLYGNHLYQATGHFWRYLVVQTSGSAPGPSGARGVLACGITFPPLQIYFQHKCIWLFGYIYVVLPEGVIPLLNPLPGGSRPNCDEDWHEPCRPGFRAFAPPSCGQSRTSQKRCKNSKDWGFWPLKAFPKSSQNAYLIESPFNMRFVIDFSCFLVVFGFVRFFFEVLKT